MKTSRLPAVVGGRTTIRIHFYEERSRFSLHADVSGLRYKLELSHLVDNVFLATFDKDCIPA